MRRVRGELWEELIRYNASTMRAVRRRTGVDVRAKTSSAQYPGSEDNDREIRSMGRRDHLRCSINLIFQERMGNGWTYRHIPRRGYPDRRVLNGSPEVRERERKRGCGGDASQREVTDHLLGQGMGSNLGRDYTSHPMPADLGTR